MSAGDEKGICVLRMFVLGVHCGAGDVSPSLIPHLVWRHARRAWVAVGCPLTTVGGKYTSAHNSRSEPLNKNPGT